MKQSRSSSLPLDEKAGSESINGLVTAGREYEVKNKGPMGESSNSSVNSGENVEEVALAVDANIGAPYVDNSDGYGENQTTTSTEQQQQDLGENAVDDPITGIPGAHAMPGILQQQSPHSESSGGGGDSSIVPPQVTITTAHLVNETAEAQQRRALENRNRELESRIQQMENQAVVAIPMVAQQEVEQGGDTQHGRDNNNNASGNDQNDDDDDWSCLKTSRGRRLAIASALVVLAVAVVALVVGMVVVADGRGDDSSSTRNTSSDAPAASVRVTDPPTNAPTHAPTYAYSWNQLGQALVGDATGDYFGYNLALSVVENGTVILAASAPGNDANGDGTGHVRVFSYDSSSSSSSWSQLGQTLGGTTLYDDFGSAIALSGNGTVLAAGAFTEPGRNGYVQVFQYSRNESSRWVQMGSDLEGRSPNDWFGGFSIALSNDGTILASGGPGRFLGATEPSGNKTGYVRVVKYDGTRSEWVPMGQDLNGTGVGDAFGRSVALSADGMILAAGADWNDGNGQEAGRVQVFSFDSDDSSWHPMGQDLDGEGPGARFGFSLAISEDGMIVAVGATNDGVAGVDPDWPFVRVYSFDNTTQRWKQMGQDIGASENSADFGTSVALSADGMILGTSVTSNNGRVRLFRYDNSTNRWNQLGGGGAQLVGEGEYDGFGSSLAVSSSKADDGIVIVAAGAPLNDGNGLDSGHVRVFETQQ